MPDLLAALDHTSGIVLGQRDVDHKTNEITVFATLLDQIDILGTLVTADALHTQTAHAKYLVEDRGAHYLLTVKRNQPTLHTQLAALPWRDVPVADTRHDKAHGPIEQRTIKVVTVAAGIGFPHAARPSRSPGRSASDDPASGAPRPSTPSPTYPPDRPARTNSRHGYAATGPSNRLHWVRDVTLGEDLSQIRTGNGQQVMATLRNLAISLHRLTGATNIAHAIRHHAADYTRPLTLLLNTS